MSACFKLLAILVVFLCLYCHETDASKEWIGNRFNDAKKMLSKRFNRETLDKFLKGGPKLFVQKTISKAKELFFKKSLGTVPLNDKDMEAFVARHPAPKSKIQNHAETQLPTNFDARQKWPQCESIAEIANQCGCGSCWAVSTSTVFSDRICIASNGTNKPRVSAMDMLSCCGNCKQGGVNADGCQGGMLPYSYEYFQKNGVVSGGKYGDTKTCKPYKWAPNSDTGFGAEYVSPRCEAKCQNSIDYNKDKYYGASINIIQPGDVEGMMREIYTKGPIAAAFFVPEDFSRYNGGIYYKTGSSNGMMGGHAIRVIGWGEENGVPYWLIANSWGRCWGEKGTFRLIRGRNELEIEKYAIAGDVDLSRSVSASG